MSKDVKGRQELEVLKRALLEIKQMRSKLDSIERARKEPIAVIGMGCRFPGADSIAEFWQLLRDGVDAVSDVPPDRWNVDDYYNPDPDVPGKSYTRSAGFIRNVDGFDAEFFRISPREASSLDPQHRLLLETSWEALEYAGLNPEKLSTRTGVFVGITTNDYLHLQIERDNAIAFDAYTATGNPLNFAAGRLSYFLGVQGPCMAIDAACASSLVTVHMACQSLRSNECDLALAAGVNLMLTPQGTVLLSRTKALSPDGRCKTFDAAADGMARGEGCGVVVLKRLSDALHDHDHVLALIRGSAIGQDGASSGLTVPNGQAQQALIREALANAGVQPSEVDYVETHGTGTSLGDPIEVRSLAAVLTDSRDAAHQVHIGSVKSNVGHLEAAAGVAGLIKTILALYHKEIPPNLHLKNPSPHIAWKDIPFTVPLRPTPWLSTHGRRFAGVSAFGLSGIISHLVLEEAPPEPVGLPEGPDRPLHVLTLTAKSKEALSQLASRYAAHLASGHSNLADVCYTANSGRAHFVHRLAIVAADAEDASRKIPDAASHIANQSKLAFLFTGQGAQYAGMGRVLYETQPVFRETLNRCSDLLKGRLDRPLLSVLYPENASDRVLHETAYTQPALFSLEYALAEVWRSWGVLPRFVAGHSVGEYAAACVAGVFSLEDAIQMVAERGRLMQQLDRGSMVAITGSEEEIARRVRPLARFVAVAAVNGPGNVVISGDGRKIQEIVHDIEAAGMRTMPLRVSHAFHSPLMDAMLPAFRRTAERVTYAAPKIALLSNVSGSVAHEGEVQTPDYWLDQLRQPVQFRSMMDTLRDQGCGMFLEIGPRPTLTALGQQCIGVEGRVWASSLREGKDDWQQMLSALTDLYVNGANVDWHGFDREYHRRRVVLPTYPFQRKRYWFTAKGETEAHPFLQTRLNSPLREIQFESRVTAASPVLEDHRINGAPVFPAAAYLEMTFAGLIRAFGAKPYELENVVISEPLVISGTEARTIQLILTPAEEGRGSFQILSCVKTSEKADWNVHVSGAFQSLEASTWTPHQRKFDELKDACTETLPPDSFYADMASRGVHLGRPFQRLTHILRGKQQAIGRLSIPDDQSRGSFHLHPGLVDSCFQLIAAAVWQQEAGLYVPVGLESVRFYGGEPQTGIWGYAVKHPEKADVALLDDSGNTLLEISGFTVKSASRTALTDESWRRCLYKYQWETVPLARAVRPDKGRWLVLSDRQGVGQQLVQALAAAGDGADVLFAADDWKHVLAGSNYRGIIHLWSLDSPRDEGLTSTELEQASMQMCGSALHIVQSLAGMAGTHIPRLWLVTQRAQPRDDGGPIQISQAALWGFGRTVALEHPELQCTCVDLDLAPDSIYPFVSELQAADDEDQIVFRGQSRMVPRLVRAERPAASTYQLEITARGVLDNLILRPLELRAPDAAEVQIEVRASGINFRDVLNVLGMYPGNAGPFGLECAGTVVAVGSDVSGIAIGDEVIAIAPGSFASLVNARADLTVPKPRHLTFEQAAGIPIAYMTAVYALQHLGQMKRGDTVLIHAAAGGVGMAAVQRAQECGARIFATAGSEEKREFLRGLGIESVTSSRSVEFVQDVMKKTDGRGVDIVLNSLAGEFIPKSISVLAQGGRFIEIGKIDIWTEAQVRAQRNDIAYAVVSFDELMTKDPTAVASIFKGLIGQFTNADLAVVPVRAFSIHEASNAFRFMAQAKHIGKVVLRHGTSRLRSDATYVITGAYGGIGQRLTTEFAGRGVRHLALIGRNAPSAEAMETINRLVTAGIEVKLIRADVSRTEEVTDAFLQIRASMPPVRGVIHAAGTLDDGILVHQNLSRFATVMAPKVSGAWNLHKATEQMPLDFFVLFSSLSAVMGSPGQANYAAANAFMDALAYYRRTCGMPAVTINWGAWAEAGSAARLAQARSSIEGAGTITVEEGFAAMTAILRSDWTQTSVFRVQWPKFLESFASRRVPSLFRSIAGRAGAGASSTSTSPSDKAAFRDRNHLRDYITGQAAKVLGLAASTHIDPQRPLNELGLDSLMAVELRNALGLLAGCALPATLLFNFPTIQALTDHLSASLLPDERTERVETDKYEDLPGRSEPIAIVGIGCRFPGGVVDTESFWRLLANGEHAITTMPADRWNVDDYYDPDPSTPGKMNTRWGGFLNRIGEFDAAFFGISPREAMSMDPQQRLVLETAWNALEDAGQAPDRLAGTSCAVFVGICQNEYARLITTPTQIDAYVSTGNAPSVAAGRISYLLGLNGPSIAVDTACSSSLVAVHLAVQSLRGGECNMALAGGVNLMISPMGTIALSELRMMAPDGRCKTFDASADGFVRSEGCGVVVLKRLRDATANGDRILAVIRGSAVNQDGRSGGLTAPNGLAQEAVIRRALSSAGVAPAEVQYVEAHGTGTSLGDPIEVQALAAVLAEGRRPDHPVAIGSVKTNMGHLEAAAGVAGLIKTVLALQHERIPPHLHLKTLSPHIAWKDIPVEVPTEGKRWPRESAAKRFAGVSSFGFSGTNAHVVLEEAPDVHDSPVPKRPAHVLTMSARTPEALKQLSVRFADYLDSTACAFADVCFTANTGRAHFNHRLAVVAANAQEAAKKLRQPQDHIRGYIEKGYEVDIQYSHISPEKLADLYVQGANVDWQAFDAGYPRHRVSLPTYPFQRKHFWFESTDSSPIDDWLYDTRWIAKPLRGAPAANDGRWLLINPALDEMPKLDASCRGVVLIIDPAADPEVSCRSTLHIVQRIAAAEGPHSPRIWIVTRGVHSLTSSPEPPNYASSVVWGLGKVAGVEHPGIWGGLIDLDNEPGTDHRNLLFHELENSDGETHIAYRNGVRHVARLTRASRLTTVPTIFKKEATYLITGGFGGIGLGLARHMVEKGARHLILIGRNEPTASVFNVLTELKNAGAQVLALRADVSLQHELTVALETASKTMPPLKGVIHAAGILSDGVLLRQNWKQFEEVMAPKVKGTLNLHAATLSSNLDFFVLFSSAASILGSPGQGNYAAANAFMDAFAEYRKAKGLPALSVNWGPWAQVGMAARSQRDHAWDTAVMGSIEPSAGAEILERIVTANRTRIAVLPVTWTAFMKREPSAGMALFVSELARHSDPAPLVHRQADLQIDGEPAVRHYLQQALEKLLRMSATDIDCDRNLTEFGLDSVMVMDLLSRIKQDLQLTLYPREFYERPTISALATYISSEIKTLPQHASQAKLPGVTFLLSSPRSGSTLLRVMLAGHPQLFCPPELHLLPFENMAERRDALASNYLGEGLQRAFMDLHATQAEDSKTMIDRLAAATVPTRDVYRMLQDLSAGRLIVDKSPSYALNTQTLARAEEWFENARYIHLIRHPYAVIDSFVRRRMGRLISNDAGENPHELAERIWATSNANLLQFLRALDPTRHHLVRYEDLVADPRGVMERLCRFLKIPFDEALLQPYEGQRMTDGVHAKSLAIGDPGFLDHKRIDSTLGDVWKSIQLTQKLGPAARKVAAELAYTVDGNAGSQMRERFVNIRGLQICLCEWGPEDGRMILCLHGMLDQGASWEPVAAALAGRGFHVIAPDQRGHGLSGHVGAEGSYHLLDFLADLDVLVRDLGKKPLTLVGHSMGAGLAAMLAVARPGAVQNLVLIECPLPSENSGLDIRSLITSQLDYATALQRHPVLPNVQTAAERLRRASPALNEELAIRLAERISQPCADSGGVCWRWDARLQTRTGMGFNSNELTRYIDILKSIGVPMTFVFASDSNFVKPGKIAGLQQSLNGSNRITLEGGHNLHLDASSAVAVVIADSVVPE